MIVLKPCPFCGAEAAFADSPAHIMCTQCSAEMTSHSGDRERIVLQWNRRTLEPDISERIAWIEHCMADGDFGRLFTPEQANRMTYELADLKARRDKQRSK